MSLAEDRVPADRAPAVRAFAQAFLRRLDADGAEGAESEALQAEIAGAFTFASARGEAPIAVRAFNPTLEGDGYETAGSVLETNTEDWPFLVDSVSNELRARGLTVQDVLHPIIGVERGADGSIEQVLHPREASTRESVMHFDLDRRLDDEELGALEDAVRDVLGDVRRTVLDFPAMADRAKRMVQMAGAGAARYDDDEVDETVSFLEWLGRDNFIFLGYREYRFTDDAIEVVGGSGLGILAHTSSSTYAQPVPLSSLAPDIRARALEGDLLIVSKTNRLSRVHRRVRMDYVGVRRISPDGQIVGEARMIGLFTTKAYSEPARDAAAEPQAAPDPARRGPDRGVARLQGGGLAVRLVPQGRAVRGADRGPAGAVVALLGLHGEQVRLLGRRESDGRSVAGDRRTAALALRRGAARAAARAAPGALQDVERGLPRRPRRGRPRAGALHGPRLRRLPRRRASASSRRR